MSNNSDTSKDKYLLGRSGLSSSRLTTQHFIIKERQGWLLHPNITEDLRGRDNLKIADLATGNGIWAIDMSKTYPNAEITGLDISSAQFPAAFTRPPNVTLGVYNLFDAVPAQYQNQFDVIHIRLIVAAIYNTDTDTILDHLTTMLKPGGYLQWDEITDGGLVVVDEDLQVDKRMLPFLRRVSDATGLDSALDFAERIPEVLAKRDFSNVQGYRLPLNPSMLQFESDLAVWVMHELFEQISGMPKEGVGLEMEKAAKELQDYVDDGKTFAYNWAVAIGQKPVLT